MFQEPLQVPEARVLGCLIEKELSTPDGYPLTLNALLLACNQTTNRDPVLTLDEAAVAEALEQLRQAQAVWFVTPAGSRVQKYAQRVTESLGHSLQERAVLAELLLRGAQTPGELRTRSTRLYAFQDLAEVEATLQVMQEAAEPLVVPLPRLPGTKETRWAATWLPMPETGSPVGAPPAAGPSRLAILEEEVRGLKEELAALRTAFLDFKNQF